MDKETAAIAAENRAAWAGKRLWCVVEEADGYYVHSHAPDGVSPSSRHGTKREAAARVLQLLQIGPVAPQTHPEMAVISTVQK